MRCCVFNTAPCLSSSSALPKKKFFSTLDPLLLNQSPTWKEALCLTFVTRDGHAAMPGFPHVSVRFQCVCSASANLAIPSAGLQRPPSWSATWNTWSRFCLGRPRTGGFFSPISRKEVPPQIYIYIYTYTCMNARSLDGGLAGNPCGFPGCASGHEEEEGAGQSATK